MCASVQKRACVWRSYGANDDSNNDARDFFFSDVNNIESQDLAGYSLFINEGSDT